MLFEMGSWTTVWQIAAKRYETKRGHGTMSDHAFEVLQNFVMVEQQNAMREALGSAYHGFGF